MSLKSAYAYNLEPEQDFEAFERLIEKLGINDTMILLQVQLDYEQDFAHNIVRLIVEYKREHGE